MYSRPALSVPLLPVILLVISSGSGAFGQESDLKKRVAEHRAKVQQSMADTRARMAEQREAAKRRREEREEARRAAKSAAAAPVSATTTLTPPPAPTPEPLDDDERHAAFEARQAAFTAKRAGMIASFEASRERHARERAEAERRMEIARLEREAEAARRPATPMSYVIEESADSADLDEPVTSDDSGQTDDASGRQLMMMRYGAQIGGVVGTMLAILIGQLLAGRRRKNSDTARASEAS